MSKSTFKDRVLAPLLNTVGEEVRSTRPLGFWIVLGEVDEDTRDDFLANNIIPIEITEKEDIPNFLFDICKYSVKKVE